MNVKKAPNLECHVSGDFLLIYCLNGNSSHEQVILVRIGNHADLFK